MAVSDEALGHQIVGHFRLLKLIGSGFCGNVFESISIRKPFQKVSFPLFLHFQLMAPPVCRQGD